MRRDNVVVPTERVPSALAVIEDFYGEQVGPRLLPVIARTPWEQLSVLAHRIVSYHRRVERALMARSAGMAVPEGFNFLTSQQLYTHDGVFLNAGRGVPISESPELKRLLLYCNGIVIPDLTIDWAEQIVKAEEVGYELWRPLGEELATAVRVLLPIRLLIRSGAVVCVGSADCFGVLDDEDVGRVELWEISRLETEANHFNAYSYDPYIAWLIINRLNPYEPWERQVLDLERPHDLLEAARYIVTQLNDHTPGHGVFTRLADVYAHRASADQIQDAVTLNMFYQRTGISPVVTSVPNQTHLTRSSHVVFDGLFTSDVDKLDAIATALKYAIPDVSGVSLADIVRLRLSEDTYNDVRMCLVDLVAAAEGFEATSYADYRRRLEEAAEDLVEPTYRRVRSQYGRRRWMASLSGFLSGGLVTMGVNGLSAFIGGAAGWATRSLGSAAGNSVRSSVRRSLDKPELNTACSILLSVGTYDLE